MALLLSSLLAAGLVLLGPPAAAAPVSGVADDVASDAARLLERRDAADPALVERLAQAGSMQALEALLEAYDLMESRFMRRAILRVLPRFDGAPSTASRAVAHLEAVARASASPLLREEALDALHQCARGGRESLRRLVESDARDSVREGAMGRLTEDPREEETRWYLELYLPSDEEGDRRGGRRDDDGGAPPSLPRVRRLAFDVVKEDLGPVELEEAARDGDREVRLQALLALEERDLERAERIAWDVLSNSSDHSENRVAAAGVLWRLLGEDVADEFYERGTDNVTPLTLRYALADFLARTPDPTTERKLARVLRRGSEYQQLFALRALRTTETPKAVRELVRAVEHDRPNVAFYAMEILAERGEQEAVRPLREVVREGRDASLAAAALGALGKLRSGAPGWPEELTGYLDHPKLEVRNAAYRLMGELESSDLLTRLIRGLEEGHWSTRLAALEAIEALHVAEALGPLIEHMQTEEGRMLGEYSEVLWRLTGQPFGRRAEAWARWWKGEGSESPLISAAELEQLDRERRERRLLERTFTAAVRQGRMPEERRSFFGAQIESTRLLFVVDVSLSMERALREPYLGSRGMRRFDVALTELRRCLDVLDGSELFGIFAFSSYLETWRPDLRRATPDALDSAHRFIDDLDMASGTDLWQALERSLSIDGLHTIYLLSDGEPEGGLIEDPVHIRMEFRRRNAQLGVELHAIALGGDLPLLRWLAEDSGGTYARYR